VSPPREETSLGGISAPAPQLGVGSFASRAPAAAPSSHTTHPTGQVPAWNSGLPRPVTNQDDFDGLFRRHAFRLLNLDQARVMKLWTVMIRKMRGDGQIVGLSAEDFVKEIGDTKIGHTVVGSWIDALIDIELLQVIGDRGRGRGNTTNYQVVDPQWRSLLPGDDWVRRPDVAQYSLYEYWDRHLDRFEGVDPRILADLPALWDALIGLMNYDGSITQSARDISGRLHDWSHTRVLSGLNALLYSGLLVRVRGGEGRSKPVYGIRDAESGQTTDP
jgi:hypothetical protein